MANRYTIRNYLFGQQQRVTQARQVSARERAAAEEDARAQGWELDHALHQESLTQAVGGLLHADVVGEMFGHVFSTHGGALDPWESE